MPIAPELKSLCEAVARLAVVMQEKSHVHQASYRNGELTRLCGLCGHDLTDWRHLQGNSRTISPDVVLAEMQQDERSGG